MPANMTIFNHRNTHVFGSATLMTQKSLIEFALDQKIISQPESNKHCTKTGNQKHTAQRRKIKIKKVVLDNEITK